jgi:hypothetical protein
VNVFSGCRLSGTDRRYMFNSRMTGAKVEGSIEKEV